MMTHFVDVDRGDVVSTSDLLLGEGFDISAREDPRPILLDEERNAAIILKRAITIETW